jgi:predicted transcriptional regulator
MPNKAKPAKSTLDKMTAVRLADHEYGRLVEIGLELDRPASWVIRQAVKEYIERYKPGGGHAR